MSAATIPTNATDAAKSILDSALQMMVTEFPGCICNVELRAGHSPGDTEFFASWSVSVLKGENFPHNWTCKSGIDLTAVIRSARTEFDVLVPEVSGAA